MYILAERGSIYSTTHIICCWVFFARIYLLNRQFGKKPKNFFDIFKNAQKLNIYSDKDHKDATFATTMTVTFIIKEYLV